MDNDTKFLENWNQPKGKLNQNEALFNKNDTLLKDDNQNELLSRLEARLGKTSEEIDRLISEF